MRDQTEDIRVARSDGVQWHGLRTISKINGLRKMTFLARRLLIGWGKPRQSAL
ncbi:MAG TPA: hypothetical protein PK178_13250 [Smithellaceae bacterium]|nr:hypothetical protein [Smithellaceae bacterium]